MKKILIVLFFCLIPYSISHAQCSPVNDSEYEIDAYWVRADAIIEEYGVTFNIAQLPEHYQIPTEIKSFSMENGIDGVVILADKENDPDLVVARLLQTAEGLLVLIVSDNITRKPQIIIKTLKGMSETRENQTNELRSVVQVGENEQGWQAKLAKTIGNGVVRLTGGNKKLAFDEEDIYKEPAGPFKQFFTQDKRMLTIRGYGPHEIRIENLVPPQRSIPGIQASFVSQVVYVNPKELYWEDLYFGDDGSLYSCP